MTMETKKRKVKNKKFENFANEAGDFTIVFDLYGEEIICGFTKTRKSADESCKRLNAILKQAKK